MPVIQRAQPKLLPPEGPAKLLVYDVAYGKSAEKHTPYFELGLRDLVTGYTMKDRLYLTDTSSWKVDACCKSMGHTLPTGPYRLGIDDLVNRVVYGLIAYRTLPISGQPAAQMKSYWTKGYAVTQAAKLEGVPDPKGIQGGVALPLVDAAPGPVPADTDAEAEAEANEAAAIAKEIARIPDDAELPEGISDEEMAEAMAYAKRLRAQKGASKKASSSGK